MVVHVVIEIYPKNEVLNPETEAVKKSLLNLGYNKIKDLVLGKKIDLFFHDLSEDKCLVNAKEICENILVNTNIQEYKISVVKDNL